MTFVPTGPSLQRTTELVTHLDAFRAMSRFLEAYWIRGGRESDDIASLLGCLEIGRPADPVPLDRATWDDFLHAIDTLSEQLR